MDDDVVEFFRYKISQRLEDEDYQFVLQMLENVSSEIKLRIRPDAIYFLANGISDLVVAPVVNVVRDGKTIVPIADLQELLPSDLWLILKTAVNVSMERGRSEISSTSAIIALGRVIEELKINDLKIWGRRSK